jgi:hypothetical protein
MTNIPNPQIGIILQDAKVQETRRPETSISIWQRVIPTLCHRNKHDKCINYGEFFSVRKHKKNPPNPNPQSQSIDDRSSPPLPRALLCVLCSWTGPKPLSTSFWCSLSGGLERVMESWALAVSVHKYFLLKQLKINKNTYFYLIIIQQCQGIYHSKSVIEFCLFI